MVHKPTLTHAGRGRESSNFGDLYGFDIEDKGGSAQLCLSRQPIAKNLLADAMSHKTQHCLSYQFQTVLAKELPSLC